MKKYLCFLLCALMIVALSTCVSTDESAVVLPPTAPQKSASTERTADSMPFAIPETAQPEPTQDSSDEEPSDTPEAVDVDLTLLSSTMVYSEVYNMMVSPEDYIGKRVKMTGAFTAFQDEATEKVYLACIIADATACCSQGLEFVLKGEHTFPDDYPALNETITVTGVFDVYEEDGYSYIQLINAEMESLT